MLFSTISLIVGTILGFVFQRYADGDVNLFSLLAGALTLIVVIVTGLCAQMFNDFVSDLDSMHRNHASELKFHRDRETDIAVHLTNLREHFSAALHRSGDHMNRAVSDLGHQLGLRVTAQSPEDMLKIALDFEREKDVFFETDQTLLALRGARKRIRMMERTAMDGARPDTSLHPKVAQRHLDEIQKRAGEGVDYTRLTQSGVARKLWPDRDAQGTGQIVRQHLLWMVGKRAPSEGKIWLRVGPDIYPYKFVLIDETTLILQLHRLEGADEKLAFDVVIHDPSALLVGQFESLWDKVAGANGTINVTKPPSD